MTIITNSTKNCCLQTSKYIDMVDYNYVLKGFNNFTELNFKNCLETQTISTLQIIPNKKLLISRSLDFKSANNKKLKIYTNVLAFFIKLYFITGFDLKEANPFESIEFINFNKLPTSVWSFAESNFYFYYENTLIDNDKHCNESLLTQSYFIKMPCFAIMESVRLSRRTCIINLRCSYCSLANTPPCVFYHF